MMKNTFFEIEGIPVVVYGDTAEQVYLFVHGRCGCKEEGQNFAELACPEGWQVLSLDLPGHGARRDAKEALTPWQVVPELWTVMAYARRRWTRVALRATSIGAWFSMLAFRDEILENCLFVSPILNMQRLIQRTMRHAGVSEETLQARQQIATDFGETLSWEYLQYAKAHPVAVWRCPTAILYAAGDGLTSRREAEEFAARFRCDLTVLESGEHWFHTEEQLAALRQWTLAHISSGQKPERPAVEVVAALIWDGDRFLACQRPARKARGLLWEFVGGKVEPGETKEQALIRECREELAVTVTVGEAFMDVTHTYPDLTVHLTLFHAAIAEGTPQKLEHEDIRWITVEELEHYDFCPADEEILDRLRKQGGRSGGSLC